ncbi:anti-sigma regulatory factor [Aneurinibacillus sp. Ricciae_BoGa-3]|uniref:anti-sigma regulatory factor n=1 Tax=Aneurinibacillus sp. Ricciae_BoGa-3 TaxID=3022697 RepID=UPI00234169FA|nr:anti-sigma regulatory factor [Aneurinibacillus sp. Ricciae_BoGa-3]WCK53691.1 anti-sigma regulatory factor [Aneurinibacillus sp. Ricciae_BoGa-3]
MVDNNPNITVYNEWDIVVARQTGRDLAKSLGFGEVDQARITTAISELARNIYLYAKKGEIELSSVYEDDKVGIRIMSRDEGPGIKDVVRALEDGYSTSGGLGAGLPGVKRLMDVFSIESAEGKGTTVNAIKWKML